MFANFQSANAFAIALLSMTLMFSSTASADHYDHIDRVALRIKKKAQRLFKETTHYRHTPEHRQLVNDTCLLRDTAIHIHDVTHFEGNLRQLKWDVALIDRTFHNLEDLFHHIELQAAHGYGHVQVKTHRARNLLKQIGRDIRQLTDGLAKIHKAAHTTYRQSYRTNTPFPTYGNRYSLHRSKSHSKSHKNRYHGDNPHHAYRNSGARTARSFSIGGGSTKIWFGL